MSQQIIDLGTGPDSQTGDDLFTAFTKVNDNFTELYSVFDGNGITEINANVLISNNIWNSGNVRTNEVFAYGNIETVSYVITAGAFYPNGVPIGDLGSITSNVVPIANGIYNLGSESYTFSNIYLSNSVVISGVNVAVENSQLVIDGQPVGNYSNTNVASYLPIYDGNTAAILTTPSQPYVTQLGTLTNLDALTANINGNLLIYGNLTVEGNITYFNIRDLSVVDPIITLNTGPNGAPLVANNGFDSGIISYYYDTQNKSAFFGRINSTGYFEYYSNVVSEVGNIVSGTYGTIKTGNLLLTQNATIDGNVTAQYFIGNIIGNVTGNVVAPGANTQIIFNDGGLLSASAGLTFDKTTNTVSTTGNIVTTSNVVVNGLTVIDNTGNVLTARLENSGVIIGTYGNSSAVPIITVDSKGRITDINVTPVAGVSNVSYDNVDSNLSIFTSAGTVFSVNLGVGTNNNPTFAGTNITGNLFAEFANANTIVTDGTAYLYNISSTGTADLTTLNVLSSADVIGNINANNISAGNLITANILLGNISGTTGTFTGNISADTLNGNISGTTGVFTGNISANTLLGNISGTIGTFTGNISASALNGNISGSTGVFTGNISADTLNGNISGTTGAFTGNISANTLNGNISGTTGTFTGNIISDKLFAATIGNTGTLLTGTLTTTNQPNITSVGSSLTIGEFNLSNNTISSTSDTITIEPADVGSTGNVIIQGNLRVTGNLTYIDSTVFTVNDKDILLANNTANISDLNGAGLLIGNASGVNLVTLKYSTSLNSWQTNVGLSPVGNVILDLGTTTTYWGNAYIGSLYSTSLTGTLETSAQPNITSVGILDGLTLSNILVGTTINASTIGNVGSILQGSSLSVSDSITGNTLQINSSANIGSILTVTGNVSAPYFIGNVVGNISGNLTAPGSDTQILFNDNNLIGANSGLIFNKTTGTLTVIGNIGADTLNGNISGTTGTFTGNISADTLNGNISGTTGTFTGNISADTLNGNISGSTGAFTGNISADTINGNISGTTGTFTGNISADTLNGNISGSTGAFTGNISADTLNGNISGTTGTFTGNISANNINSTNEIQSSSLVVTSNATVGNLSTSGLISTTNSTNSTSNVTGAVVISGGIGVGKNLYVGNAVGWVYSNAVSAVYQVYNSVTNSLDTIFG